EQSLLSDGGERFGDLVEDYLDFKRVEQRKSAHTISNARCVLRIVSDLLGNPLLEDLQEDRMRDWVKKMLHAERGGLSVATVRTYVAITKAYFSYCVDRRKFRVNPLKGIRLPVAKTSRRQKYCTPMERDVLLAAVEREAGVDLAKVFYFGFLAGMRPGEILAMERNWLFFSRDGRSGSITVQETEHWRPKNKESRVIPMNWRLLCFLKRVPLGEGYVVAPDHSLWKDPPKKRFFFEKTFVRFCARHIDRMRVSPYVMRHSFATHLAMGGASPMEVASLLGDDLQVVLDHYIGFFPAQDHTVNKMV
ncbi:MAG: tyrosine-type recombinase/integrase, partial [Verrucomicrobiales bacterium]